MKTRQEACAQWTDFQLLFVADLRLESISAGWSGTMNVYRLGFKKSIIMQTQEGSATWNWVPGQQATDSRDKGRAVTALPC